MKIEHLEFLKKFVSDINFYTKIIKLSNEEIDRLINGIKRIIDLNEQRNEEKFDENVLEEFILIYINDYITSDTKNVVALMDETSILRDVYDINNIKYFCKTAKPEYIEIFKTSLSKIYPASFVCKVADRYARVTSSLKEHDNKEKNAILNFLGTLEIYDDEANETKDRKDFYPTNFENIMVLVERYLEKRKYEQLYFSPTLVRNLDLRNHLVLIHSYDCLSTKLDAITNSDKARIMQSVLSILLNENYLKKLDYKEIFRRINYILDLNDLKSDLLNKIAIIEYMAYNTEFINLIVFNYDYDTFVKIIDIVVSSFYDISILLNEDLYQCLSISDVIDIINHYHSLSNDKRIIDIALDNSLDTKEKKFEAINSLEYEMTVSEYLSLIADTNGLYTNLNKDGIKEFDENTIVHGIKPILQKSKE